MVDLLVETPLGTSDPGGARRAVRNLALDEALARAEPARPVLRLWRNTPCCVLGRFQRAEREVDLAVCVRDGVRVLRRASGGGTVYHDLGTLNVTLVLPGQVRGATQVLAGVLTRIVAGLGPTATVTGRGVFVDGRKLAGLACLRTARVTLVHACLLVRTPGWRVREYLLPAPTSPRPLDSHRAPVASLAEHGLPVDTDTVGGAAVEAARELVGPVRPRPLRAAERRWRERLLTERYQDPAWHLTGRERKEASWTTTRESACTGRWC